MKILYHHRTRATDAQRVHILEITRALREAGHSVSIVSLVDTEKPVHDASFEAREAAWKPLVRRIPFSYEMLQIGYNLIAIPWLVWRVVRERIDFIYERYSLFNCSAVIAGALTGRPVVLEVNSPLALEESRERAIRATHLAGRMETMICNLATRVLVVSGPLARILEKSGVCARKLAIVPNGVNLRHLREVSDVEFLRSSLGLSGRTVIGFVGWLRSWHGLEMLIEAFAASRLPECGASLLIIGDGPAMPDLRTLVARHNLLHHVVFVGAVPHEKLPQYLHLIDIAVQPAANEYCCPMKIIEYMGLGKAILAPRQENITELLTEDIDSILFPPGDRDALGDAMRQLANAPVIRKRLGAAALETVCRRGLLWSHNADVIVDLATTKTGRYSTATVSSG